MSEKTMVGSTIVAHGQTATIVNVVTVDGKLLMYLDHSIVVPTQEYNRDYIQSDEIQKIVSK